MVVDWVVMLASMTTGNLRLFHKYLVKVSCGSMIYFRQTMTMTKHFSSACTSFVAMEVMMNQTGRNRNRARCCQDSNRYGEKISGAITLGRRDSQKGEPKISQECAGNPEVRLFYFPPDAFGSNHMILSRKLIVKSYLLNL